MEKQNENKETSLLFNIDQATHFSDSVLLETKEDVVIMNFTQTMPQSTTPDAQDRGFQSRIVSRVVLTVPHFFRLADVCRRVAEQIKERENGEVS